VRAADRFGAGFGKAEMPDLSCGNQFFDRPRNILDRHVRIDTVLVKQVYRIHPEALQRSLGDRLDVLRTAVQSATALARFEIDIEAELGRDDNLSLEGASASPTSASLMNGP
jgi:hypothetical protein